MASSICSKRAFAPLSHFFLLSNVEIDDCGGVKGKSGYDEEVPDVGHTHCRGRGAALRLKL